MFLSTSSANLHIQKENFTPSRNAASKIGGSSSGFKVFSEENSVGPLSLVTPQKAFSGGSNTTTPGGIGTKMVLMPLGGGGGALKSAVKGLYLKRDLRRDID